MVLDGSMVTIMESESVNLSHNFQLGNLLDMRQEPRKCDKVLQVTDLSNRMEGCVFYGGWKHQ